MGRATAGSGTTLTMCGICGSVTFSEASLQEITQLRVRDMLKSLSHRGPDAVGQVNTAHAIMGVTRLAIRGMDEVVNQPMLDAATGVIAVCNGEIDNHHELRAWLAARGRPVQRHTDVAVIPGLYLELGAEFVNKLCGAFVIALWDPRCRQLLLVRDRAGERPLFYARHGPEIIFANEIAALADHGRLPVNLDPLALRKYLQFGIFPSPDTPFREIRKVAPGELIIFKSQDARRKSYWRWPIIETPKAKPSLDAFDQIFRGAVARQSQVDVGFGVFLSGGIDSSLVSAVLRSLYPKRPLKAYTLRFEEESFDEGNFAEAVARGLKMELATVWVKPDDVREGLKSILNLVGEPLADPAWIPAALLARRAAHDVKLVLVGEGADELFGGYPTYLGAGLAEQFARLPGWIKRAIGRVLSMLPSSEKKVTVAFLLKRFADGAELPDLDRHRHWVANISPTLLAQLGVAPAEDGGECSAEGLLLDRLQRWDLETSLAEGLLTKADRSGMSSALELRAPFLDESVLTFAASLPVSERVRKFQTKVFLKRYAGRYLPEEIIHRRKRGLSVPIARWLRGPLRDWASGSLGSGRLEQAGIRTAAALELFAQHLHREADHARALWTLIVLSEWLDWVKKETRTDA